MQIAVEPGDCKLPSAIGGRARNSQGLRSLSDLKANEATQLYEIGCLRMLVREAFHRFIHCEQSFVVFCIERYLQTINSDSLLATTMTDGAALPRPIDQDVTHGFGGSREEVHSTFPLRPAEPQPRLVHQGCRLQRASTRQLSHRARRNLSQLLIHGGHEIYSRARFAFLIIHA